MLHHNLVADEQKWLQKIIPPAPEVFILAFAGTSCKEWKLVIMLSKEEYTKQTEAEWEANILQRYPSAQLVKVYHSVKEV